jgi:hypothetical protein
VVEIMKSGYGIYGVSGKDLIIAHDRKEAFKFVREHFPYKEGYKTVLKMTSGRGENIKTYRVSFVKK